MADETKFSTAPILSEDNQTLSQRINTSTRSIHTHLNRLILARLPLALPPYSFCPSTYIFGLLYIASIYITFESLWQTIVDEQRQSLDNESARDAVNPIHSQRSRFPTILAKECCRRNEILSNLQVEGLLRSERLRADIRTLSGIPDQDVEEELQAISQNGKVSNFIAHTTRSVNANPHVLLAYAWVLYMALFAGGRHLRASLQNAGSNFWEISRGVFPLQQSKDRTTPSPIEGGKRESEGLAFFHFPGEEDGEDIKRNFKRCFTEAEALLSDREKDDIVCEAQHIFAFLVELIGELDQKQLLRRQDAPPKDQSVGVSGALSRAGIPAVNINVKLGQCLALSSLLAFLVWCSIGR